MAPGGRLLACAAGALAFAVGGCSGEDADVAGGADGDTEAGPPPTSDAPCPVTEPTPTEDLPEVLRAVGGPWTGRDGLWTRIPAAEEFIADDGPLRIKHAWVTLDEEGQPTEELGDPGVRADGLDGQGTGEAGHGGYATDATLSWWPTGVEFPAPGCWAETGSVAGVEVRVVFEVP